MLLFACGIADKFKLNCDKPIAETEIQINVILSARTIIFVLRHMFFSVVIFIVFFSVYDCLLIRSTFERLFY